MPTSAGASRDMYRSSWLRLKRSRATTAPRLSRPIRWNQILPTSMPIVVTLIISSIVLPRQDSAALVGADHSTKYGGMDVSDAKRLKALEDENAKLKKLLADQMLEASALRELLCKKMVGPAAKREAVAHLRAVMGLSERRACSVVGADRKMIRYRSCRPPETELRGRLRDLANERRRFGYRRLFILLRREGEPSGINRIYRLYREEGLTVRKRRARRRAVGTRAPILVEARPNARWSLDFVHDQFACGRRFRVLNIVDDVTRECLAAFPTPRSPVAGWHGN